MYQRKDHYYKKAKVEGRASRASYKLEQIQSKFKIIKKGDFVLDLGCAPGSWMEVAGGIVGEKGHVIGIDILPIKIKLRSNMEFIQGKIGDITASLVVSRWSLVKPTTNDQRLTADVILSDMAPNTSGVAFKDSYLSYELCMQALSVAKLLLKPGGNFITKIFQGEEVEGFKKTIAGLFKKVAVFIPPATREASKELYIIATGFRSS